MNLQPRITTNDSGPVKAFFYNLPFSLFFFLACTQLFAQSQAQLKKIDSLTVKLAKDSAHIYRFKMVRPYSSLDYHYAILRDAPVDLKGIQLGIRVFGKHKFGFGAYDMKNKAKQKVKSFEQNLDANQQLMLSYFTGFYKYSLVDHRFFELVVCGEAGGGKYDLTYFNIETDEKISHNADYILPTGTGLNLNLKPLRWVGISGMAGYRYMFGIAGRRINFNGLFYSYGVWIDLRQIYRDTRYYLGKKPVYRKNIREVLASNT